MNKAPVLYIIVPCYNEEEVLPEPYEETYRDGSPKNECWGSDR